MDAYSDVTGLGYSRSPRGLTLDIQIFFALPVPRAAWPEIRPLQNRDFVDFLEARLRM